MYTVFDNSSCMMFKFAILLFLTYSTVYANFFQGIDIQTFCYLKKSITSLEHYYQIILLVNDSAHKVFIESNFIKKCTIYDRPVIIISYKNLNTIKSSLEFPSFGSPRATTLFITLIHESEFSIFKNILDTYSKIWIHSIRPKWLMIFLNKDMHFNRINFERSLLYAWKKYFLDFTILETKGFKEITIHYYDPFKNHFQSDLFNEASDIFPDKLHDMNGYILKTIFVHDPPSLFLQQDEFGNIININSTDYWSILAISKVMNFTLKILPTFEDDYVTKSYRTSFSKMSRAILKGETDFSGNRLYLWDNDKLSRSYMLWPDGYCALVTVHPRDQFHLPAGFYIIIYFTIFCVLILEITAKLMRFNKKFWTWATPIQILLGISMVKQPRVLNERILVGCVILLSLFYVSDFYAKMTDVKVTTVQESFTSFDDLDSSGLTPLVYPQYFNKTFRAFNHKHKIMQNLKKKAKFWSNPATCADYIIKPDSHSFCILNELLGQDMIEKFRYKNKKTSRLYIMKPCFWITWKGFAFTPKSPYVEKFDEILTRIIETGLLAKWVLMVAAPRTLSFHDDNSFIKGDTNLNVQILFVVGIGCVTATVTFLMELAFYKWKLNNKFKYIFRKYKKIITSSISRFHNKINKRTIKLSYNEKMEDTTYVARVHRIIAEYTYLD